MRLALAVLVTSSLLAWTAVAQAATPSGGSVGTGPRPRGPARSIARTPPFRTYSVSSLFSSCTGTACRTFEERPCEAPTCASFSLTVTDRGEDQVVEITVRTLARPQPVPARTCVLGVDDLACAPEALVRIRHPDGRLERQYGAAHEDHPMRSRRWLRPGTYEIQYVNSYLPPPSYEATAALGPAF